MFSIYHFFAHLIRHKRLFVTIEKLEDFPFDVELLSCRNIGVFPDMAIRLNGSRSDLIGGELIELKDSKSYNISSFNSTIPTGKKRIDRLVSGQRSSIREQMEAAGDDIFSLRERDVYYLLRGRKQGHTKVCLVNGKFFETIPVDELISESFAQVLDDRMASGDLKLDDNLREALVSIFSDQESFSKVRHVDKASVKLRFRIMTEVKRESNIFNASQYKDIKDNTLNLVIPCHNASEQSILENAMRQALGLSEYNDLGILTIQHPFNGAFLVFQIEI